MSNQAEIYPSQDYGTRWKYCELCGLPYDLDKLHYPVTSAGAHIPNDLVCNTCDPQEIPDETKESPTPGDPGRLQPD